MILEVFSKFKDCIILRNYRAGFYLRKGLNKEKSTVKLWKKRILNLQSSYKLHDALVYYWYITGRYVMFENVLIYCILW